MDRGTIDPTEFGESAWGLATHDLNPSPLGGPDSGLTWFESEESLLDFLAEDLAYAFAESSSTDPTIVAGKTATVVADLRSGAIKKKAALEALTKVMKHSVKIRWWGPISDLMNSKEALPREVRSWYRGRISDDEEADDTPIDAEEFDDFVGALLEYGL